MVAPVIFNVAVVTLEYGAVFVRFVHVLPPLVLTCHWKEVGVLLKLAVKEVFAFAQMVDADGCDAIVGQTAAGIT